MVILEWSIVAAATSVATFALTLWLAYSLDRNWRYDGREVPFSQRLRHPLASPDELGKKCAERRRGRGE